MSTSLNLHPHAFVRTALAAALAVAATSAFAQEAGAERAAGSLSFGKTAALDAPAADAHERVRVKIETRGHVPLSWLVVARRRRTFSIAACGA